MDIFNKKAKESEHSTGKLDDAFRALSPSALSAVAGVTALVASIKSLIGVGNQIINVSSQFEQTQKSLETVLQSAEKGQALFEDLRKFSFDTTFGIDELASASSQLLNVGVSTKLLQKDLKMLGDLAQGDKAKFQELTSIFSKIQSTGKATSIQLQQLALRGIPIMQILKDMGVEGTASAEDITKAFQKLTDEGGQFHDAMNNIIDTIEGKKGFISDTWKEILVNFGKVSGLTDSYKEVLDTVYGILDKINNKLMQWNENPVHKAILQGVLKASLLALVGVIVASLIPALTTVVTLLGGIDPTVWLRLGVGALTGAILGVASASKKFHDEMTGVKDVVQEAKDLIADLDLGDISTGKAYKNQKKGMSTTEEDTVVAIDRLKQAKLYVVELEEDIKNLERALQNGDGAWYNDTMIYGENIEYVLKNVKKNKAEQERLVKVLELQEKYQEGILKQEQGRADAVKQVSDYYAQLEEEFERYRSQLGEAYAENSKIGKVTKELEENEKKINELLAFRSNKYYSQDEKGNRKLLQLTPEEQAKFEKDLNALKEKNKQLKIELAVTNMKDWQKVLQKSFGFTDEEVSEGFVSTGAQAVEKLKEKLAKSSEITKSFSDKGLINISNLDLAQQKLDAINQKIKDIRDSGLWEADEGTVDDLKALQQSAINDVYTERISKAQEELAIMRDQTGELEKQYQLEMLKEQGFSPEQAKDLLKIEKERSDLLNLQSDAWGYLTSKIVEFAKGEIDITELAKAFGDTLKQVATTQLPSVLVNGFETIGKALAEGANAGAELMKQFKQMIAQMLKSLATACITAGVQLIASGGWAGVPPALALFALGGASGIASGFIGSIGEGQDASAEQQKQLELLKSLNQQYKDLSNAIREQEEYYLKKKHELNAFELKNYVQTTPVNDMILTPHGNFSTHPNDTIIATKDPSSLGADRSVNVTINNYSDNNVDVEQRTNAEGMKELFVTISKKIASDVAGGYNGWDSAFAMQKQRVEGRRL